MFCLTSVYCAHYTPQFLNFLRPWLNNLVGNVIACVSTADTKWLSFHIVNRGEGHWIPPSLLLAEII